MSLSLIILASVMIRITCFPQNSEIANDIKKASVSSVASVASSTDSLQGVEQDHEAGAAGSSSIAVASISVSCFHEFFSLTSRHESWFL